MRVWTLETSPTNAGRDDVPADMWLWANMADALAAKGQPAPAFPQTPGPHRAIPYVNHNRWLFDCPICDNTTFTADSVRGYCCTCRNGEQGWIELVWPENRIFIEAALETRPDPATRNWTPGETVEVLIAENYAHAVGN